ncbi:MAG: parallel beta-helix domain-containing protein [Anaerolineae bacterium]
MTQQTARKRRLWPAIFLVLGLFLCSIGTAFAFIPAPEDPTIPAGEQGGGARQDDQAVSGLDLAWPELAPVDANQAALGRLLFFDPILSRNDNMACASCHQPDLGFSDGRTVAQGSHGEDLRRNTPSLWNVAYATSLFWDGRASNLEDQMLTPLTSENEMGADVTVMVEQLQAIPEYQAMFTTAFPGSETAITQENVASAIAAYERTLISNNSPFDRFAAGDFNALTPAQRRGFDVFRSAQTRCFECHAWPNFTHSTFHVLGVPDTDPAHPDLGRIETVNAAPGERAFRTPSLRNVALSAPYMHNGAFATLEEVVHFYSEGGGPAFGVDIAVDEKVQGFTLTDQQTADLIQFLYALTDEPSDLIAIPESVPSGLPVIAHSENAARALVETSTAPPTEQIANHQPVTLTVHAGESIQAGVDQALPGDTVEVEPGIYHETVYVDRPNITIRGLVDGENRPWIEGDGVLSDGFNTTGDDFVLEGFGVRNTIGNGVLTTGAERVAFRDLIIENAGIYGLYPVECTDVLIENVEASGIADAAIYVGQSRGPIIVRNNFVHDNVTGIEIENSTNAEVYGNHAYDNSGGILVFLLPNNPSRVGYNTRVYDNLVEHNNHQNFGRANTVVSKVPSGTGIFIMTADNTEVFNNTIRENQSFGVGLTSLYIIYPRDTVFDLGPIPENNWIHDNTYEHNGYAPDPSLTDFGVSGADLLWTGEGWTNSWDEPGASSFPPVLPSRNTPDPLRRALWRFYDVVIQALL